ncbi:hypothetical protein [Streptomyces nanshensis]|uniref:hypothetical protein n=1 Tax=Streptomyces nanshensis TaxID=518642 RepID=UPI00114CF252|nr:hypothetical protein [Streptomyces nanshensis]
MMLSNHQLRELAEIRAAETGETVDRAAEVLGGAGRVRSCGDSPRLDSPHERNDGEQLAKVYTFPVGDRW